ncbi:Wzz/FepE/Etk N-terminal domain-containing protein [Fusobacterium sp.]|uniref:Wzz/FepE/Etk N-terminal domain-containing protein n=1 Tax=Fusobacterium sp. TaxID=68766 RepID=UPI00261E60B1|nr:Wzz/FepE/Etk N-terminal domain-containing protein [Fusobacterium sp.]
MEKFEVERYEEDEIDLVDLLKTIIKGKNIIIITTILGIILSGAFIFYKNNKAYNYGVNITLSEETTNKISQYNSIYKNVSIELNNIIQTSFDSLMNIKESEITTLSSVETQEIDTALKNEYDFIKIIDTKDKTYKLFTKTKKQEINNIIDKIDSTIENDTKILNNNFNKELSITINSLEKELSDTTNKVEFLNKEIMNIIEKNLKNSTSDNYSSNLSIISPILYVEYQDRIKDLNDLYSKTINLKKIEKNSNDFFELSGKKDINKIILKNTATENGPSSKLILLIGAFLGIFLGVFVAIIKNPLKNIINDIKKEN